MRIHPAIACTALAATIGHTAKSAYVNPDTVPVMLNIPTTFASLYEGYFPLEGSADLSKYFKEYTSPGPYLTFTLNKPAAYGMADSFRLQINWLDPEPEQPVESDSNWTSDTDDERFVGQMLDLTDISATTYVLLNTVGFEDSVSPSLVDTIFWRTAFGYDSEGVTDYSKPWTIEAGNYKVSDDDAGNLVAATGVWGSPSYNDTDYTEGRVSLYAATNDYSLVFNLTDNTDNLYAGYIATFGKVFDEDMPVVKALSGYTGSTYDVSNVWEASASLTSIPLWATYTEEDFSSSTKPTRDDYITIDSITIHDLAEVAPSHGLKFIEDLPHIEEAEDEDEEDETVDPNATIRKYFDISITEDGLVTYAVKEGVNLSDISSGYYTFYFRVYVDDGTNNGVDGYYYRQSFQIYLYRPFYMYLGDAAYSSFVDYGLDDDESTEEDESTTDYWYWYKSSKFGWNLIHDFPTDRKVYSYEHGWIYMFGETATEAEGVNWYMYPTSYDDGDPATEYVDDTIGWVWTNYANYPFLYSYKDEGWIRYMKDFSLNKYDENDDGMNLLNERVFWSYRQGKYLKAEQLGAGLDK
ncbi:MAG: hypothetical protein JW942_05460 [Opitutales bacterium]|nr:hypothetical protein [Opitutales bacterium]